VEAVREYPKWLVAHADFGDPECCGLLFPVERGEESDIACNECGTVILSVPAAAARRTMDHMELAQDVASERCPHCGSVNLFPGFSRMFAFTCRGCGAAVKTGE
jgi:DNA-directed RNA polymerase subunit RPC12/RpoP